MALKSIGIVGCGAIGKALIKAVEDRKLAVSVAGVTSRTEKNAREFLAAFKNPPPYLSLDELVQASDLLVEAAGGHVVAELAKKVFAAGKDLMVISVGAVTHVTHTTRKPPLGLEGAPYLVERGISLVGLQEETEVFSGSAREACRGFPANVNVTGAVSLAGIGPDKTRVRILAVPGLPRNCHDIDIEGEFGKLHVHIENVPTENPKTGKLTALSIIRAVQDVIDPVRIGN